MRACWAGFRACGGGSLLVVGPSRGVGADVAEVVEEGGEVVVAEVAGALAILVLGGEVVAVDGFGVVAVGCTEVAVGGCRRLPLSTGELADLPCLAAGPDIGDEHVEGIIRALPRFPLEGVRGCVFLPFFLPFFLPLSCGFGLGFAWVVRGFRFGFLWVIRGFFFGFLRCLFGAGTASFFAVFPIGEPPCLHGILQLPGEPVNDQIIALETVQIACQPHLFGRHPAGLHPAPVVPMPAASHDSSVLLIAAPPQQRDPCRALGGFGSDELG